MAPLITHTLSRTYSRTHVCTHLHVHIHTLTATHTHIYTQTPRPTPQLHSKPSPHFHILVSHSIFTATCAPGRAGVTVSLLQGKKPGSLVLFENLEMAQQDSEGGTRFEAGVRVEREASSRAGSGSCGTAGWQWGEQWGGCCRFSLSPGLVPSSE